MTTAEICDLLGLEPMDWDVSPGPRMPVWPAPEKIREAIAALPPGPVLDEMACRAVGLERLPEQWFWVRITYGGVLSSWETDREGIPDHQINGRLPPGWLPVSSDPAAAHQLAMAALEKGWELSLHYGVPPAAASRAQSGLCFRVEGKTAMHAAALAVAITGLERSKP